MIKIGKEFKPDPALKSLYYIYAMLAFLPMFSMLAFVLFISPEIAFFINWFLVIPTFLLLAAISLWIPLYYRSMFYEVGKKELVARRGVWFRKKSIVPYSKITNMDMTQGPLNRALGISTIKVQTAGYSYPSTTPVEIKMEGLRDPEGVRKAIDRFIR